MEVTDSELVISKYGRLNHVDCWMDKGFNIKKI